MGPRLAIGALTLSPDTPRAGAARGAGGGGAGAAGRTVILSAHALDATPPRDALLALVDRAAALGADVTKLAAHARNLDDVRTLLEVTLAAPARGAGPPPLGP